MSDKTQLVPKKDSKKRTKPPSTTPSPSAATPKKLRREHETESLLDVSEIVETKLQELPDTAGNDEYSNKISEDPRPSPNHNGKIPPWAQELWTMLKSVKEDIALVREDILVLQNRIPRRLDTTQQHRPSPPHEAMDIEIPQNELSSPIIREGEHKILKENEQKIHDGKHNSESRPPHANYLDECFSNRIGLPVDSRQEVDITTFDGVLVAKGYNRILPTWQGYYIELEEKDLVKANLELNEFPALGQKSWLSPGLKVFRLTKPDNRRTPRAHRFAIKTPPDFTGRCNPLQLGKYYIHAYQARFLVGDYSRSLNSRAMALNLSNMFPHRYQPRRRDTDNTARREEDRLRNEPNRPSNHAVIPPNTVPTPFVPLTNLPNPWNIPKIVPYGAPYLQQPSMPHNFTPHTFMPPTPFQQTPPTFRYAPTHTAATTLPYQWNTAAASNSLQTYNAHQQRPQEDLYARGRQQNTPPFNHPPAA